MARFLKSFRRTVQPLEVHGFVHQFDLFCIRTFTGFSGRGEMVLDQAWSNGMAVILLTLGVFTWWMCITKDGGHDDLLRAFCGVSFFPPFPFLIPMATGDPGLGAVLCLFVLHTFLSGCALGSAVWIFQNTMLNFLVRLPPDSNIAFCP